MDNYPYNPYTFFHPTSTEIGIYIVWVVIQVAGLWMIFTKAGKPGWAAIVPIYSAIVLLQVVGKPWWWILLILIPCVNFILIIIGVIWISNLLSKSFGQGIGFTLGLIFLGFIFYPLLGFGDYTYLGPGGTPITFGANDYERPFDINP
jgi:hypothetical protein